MLYNGSDRCVDKNVFCCYPISLRNERSFKCVEHVLDQFQLFRIQITSVDNERVEEIKLIPVPDLLYLTISLYSHTDFH